ncbi:MerR family DNA-binding transcriptional regulator [Novipirellula aureliae]|uniref:MerR family DNA-binding transcriptional regulator n=1 Tax=Novipirellula aureliae TaxID=2527966 RepID=UPI0011B7EC73|nr:helix-turn-helix domain-containing protein [Novipirellula aureliae]
MMIEQNDSDDDADDSHNLLTITEASRIAGVSTATLRKWISMGLLPARQMPGSRWRRIRRGVLIAFLRGE